MTTPATNESEDIPPEWRERDARARAQRESEEAEAARDAEAALERLKVATCIPAKFLDIVDGGHVLNTKAKAEVERGGFEILVLSGLVGNGKTVAAARWLIDGLRAPPTPLFVTSARLSRWDRYDNAAMDRLLLASRLVIDDLGEEFNDTKGNFLAVLDETISDRLANNRPTVITTNLDLDQFTERYGVRVRDRIKESGRWVEFVDPSMRGKQTAIPPPDNPSTGGSA